MDILSQWEEMCSDISEYEQLKKNVEEKRCELEKDCVLQDVLSRKYFPEAYAVDIANYTQLNQFVNNKRNYIRDKDAFPLSCGIILNVERGKIIAYKAFTEHFKHLELTRNRLRNLRKSAKQKTADK